MMRWLKDKKKEKRSSMSSQIDDEKEDDYGFGKEKAASKSSSSRRELPPTPATPEERSPHIYEEIPDLSYSSMSDNEIALLQSKFSKIKNGLIATAGSIPDSTSLAIKSFSSDKDEISPYLIVPVDNEVRQTPTDFHRNGTPEVHCDVIVKDTHCEILLTRKPKVGAFRLDNPALSAAGDSDDKKSIRNNTHFCSRDRRANSYVQSAGNLLSAFSATLSSSPATKIKSSTMGNLTESLEPCQENDLDKAEDNGVVTYSTASNFIPRATKLVFHPLPGNNPCKEAFGSDSSDELRGVGYSSIKEDDFEMGGASFASGRELQPGSKCVTYATVEFHGSLEPGAESQVTYASVQDQHFTNSQTKLNFSFDDHNNAQSHNKMLQKIHRDSSGDTNSSRVATRTGIIRPLSPSNSSNCIYALVTFPTESTHYNTISDISPSDFPENVLKHEERFRGLVYSSANERFGANTVYLPCAGEKCDTSNHEAPSSFHLSDTQRELSQTSCFNFSERTHSKVNVDRVRFDSQSYRGIVDHTDLKEGQLTANGAQPSACAKISPEPHTSSGQSNILLEFCFCSDERSSSCDCTDAKHSQNDDLASVAGAASEGSNSCRSCGRLIRQITYSESYSDETYDHVYSSRLLIKTGRRFSSPDITFSEVSNSEFPDVQNPRSLDFPYAASRDDSWASPRNSDIFPPSYSASAESKLFYKIDNAPQFKDQTSVDDLRCSYNNDRESSEISQYTFLSSKHVEQYSCETSEHAPTHYTLNLPANKRSATASDKQPKCKVGKNESWVLKTENTSVLNNPGQSTQSSSADHSKSIRESTFDKSVVVKSGSDNFCYERSAGGKSAVENYVVDGSIVDKSFADKSKKLDKSVSDKSKKLDKSAADKSKKLDKPVAEKAKKLESALALEPKSGGFTGLLMKFSRTKPWKPAKPEEAENANCYCAPEEQLPLEESVRCDKDLEEIPDKNTRKLSHFFQRLASKELTTKDTTDCAMSQETDELASTLTFNNVRLTGKSLKLLPLESNTVIQKSTNYKHCRDDKNNTVLQTVKVAEEAQICWSSTEISEINVASQLHIFPTKKQMCTTRTPVAAISDHMLSEASRVLDKDVASEGLLSNSNPQFKTDSGDTCYEYDISTSSEGEQPGYEYFLSKVKKSLNLDREVQHISDPKVVRRKCLCKRCKNGLYATIDDDENDIVGKDGLCPYLAAKFGDMCAMFEDLVVDQRAAILDCLSDYTLNPYGSRGHNQDGGYCRDCGCEILPSDSESLTTVSSLLSQQFRMTSPNGQTMSCDSDEGTMADNSCESADENGESKNNGNKCHYEGHSSGYDEPKGKSESAGQKSRRKERKEKKSVSSSATHFATNEPAEKLSLSLSNTIHNGSPTEALLVQTSKDENKTVISSVSAESHRKSILKKNTSSQLSAHSSRHAAGLSTSPVSESKDDHSKICDISRSRTSTLTDKVLQDIYSPLPSKALSRLTSRSFSSPVGLSCSCGRGTQASLATVTAHLATGKTITPPSGCTRKDNSLKLSPTSLPHCDGDEKVRVAPVQKHSEKGGKTGNEGEQFILNERKDNLKNDPRTMDIHCEKDVLENNDCGPTPENVESNECLPPQTKPGNRTFRKQRSPVPAKEGSPLRNRTPTTKQFSESASASGCGVFASSQHEKQCAQMSLPHTTQNAAASAFNPEITVAVNSEHVCSETPFSDAYERSFVELKSEDSKTESTRKHRLKIVALDLLPESVVDGDNIASTHTQKKLAIQPKRSKVIATMAKLFESNSAFTNDNQIITEAMLLDSTTKKDSGHKARLHKEYTNETESQNIVSQQRTENNFISEFSENISNSPGTRPKRSFPATALLNPTRQDNLCGRRESHNLNLNANPPASDLLATSKTLRSRSRSKQGKENETKAAKSDNESGRLKSVKVKSGKTKSPHLKESRFPKQRSPTPSSSSSISSSSSKRKSGHAKTKTSKQSYSRKRSKHRSERNKNGHGKEERTYYYFSSDFSDIDVVEVENCEPYNTAASKDSSTNNKLAISIKKRCASSENLLTSTDHSTELPAASTNNTNESAADGGSCEQEVYAIPGSSSDLRGRKNSNEAEGSPQPSPEMTKYRKMKRTDVYKSMKSNNKLLSDLIIRNYDMQVYGNI